MGNMNFVIFDDEKRSNFFPITLTRSTGNIRVGILKLRQRISSYFDLSETNDHSKTGINSTIDAGTVIGIGCNLFELGMIKKYISSFNFETESEKELYSKIYKKVFRSIS